MPLHHLLAFAAVYALGAASPGPGVAAIVARGLERGSDGAAAFVAGFTVGDIIWVSLTVFGLAAAAKAQPQLFLALRYAGAGYLLWLAWQLWTRVPQAISLADAPRRRDLAPFLGGLSLTLGNPKSMVFYLAVVPTVVPIASLGAAGIAQMLAVVVLLNPTILGGYAYAAARAQKLFQDPRRLQRVNRTMAVLLLGAAAAVALR